MGGGQIDSDAADRELKAAVLDGGAHPLPGSFTAASGRPTRVKAGRPLDRSHSTDTG